MRDLRRNPVLFDFLALDLAREGWEQQQRIKEIEAKNKPPGSTFAMREDDADEDTNEYLDWLFGDKPKPADPDDVPTLWRRPAPAPNVDLTEDDEFEDMAERLRNYRQRPPEK
jgi:hypothetical protein